MPPRKSTADTSTNERKKSAHSDPGDSKTPGDNKTRNKETNVQPQTTDECIFTHTNGTKGAFIAAGEQGSLYNFGENTVLKVSIFKVPGDRVAWQNEAKIGQILGELGVAPRIERYFECSAGDLRHGVIVMQRLDVFPTVKVDTITDAMERINNSLSPEIVRYNLENSDGQVAVDDLQRIPHDIQRKFITVLETMINHDYIHMDNHIGNLGFIKGQPVVFDFGFVQHRANIDRRWALCFSLCQILQSCPYSSIVGTEFYRVATACYHNTYTWGNPRSGGPAVPLSSFACTATALVCVRNIIQQETKKTTATSLSRASLDLRVGSLAALTLLTNPTRHGAALDLVYLIRNPAHIDIAQNIRVMAQKIQYVAAPKLV